MDKFGIFNVLSSLANLYEKSKSQENSDSSKQSQRESPEVKPSTQKASFAPLQNNMINTMSSHDEFVKRVLEKHKN